MSPRTPGSVVGHRQLDVRRELHADRVAVVLRGSAPGGCRRAARDRRRRVSALQRERLEALLIHEVEAVAVGVRGTSPTTCTRSGSANFSPALKVLSKTARVSRFRILSAHERLAAARRRSRDLDVEAVRRGAFSNSKNVFRLISMASIRLGTSRVYRSRVGRCVQQVVDLALFK